MNWLSLEENTIAIFAHIRSIYSNIIYNTVDKRAGQSPWWLYGHWLGYGAPLDFHKQHRKELDFGFSICGTYRLTDAHFTSREWWVRRVLGPSAKRRSCTAQEDLPRVKFCGRTSTTPPTVIQKPKPNQKNLQPGKEKMGKGQKRCTKVSVALVCLAKKRLISRGGRSSGLMWTLILKQCVFIAGDHKT